MKILIGFLCGFCFSLQIFAATALNGVWEKPCENQEGDFISSKLTIKKNQWNVSRWGYEDEKCQQKYIQFDLKFQVSAADYEMDMKVVDALYTPKTKEVARALNEAGFCGINNWKKNHAQSVLGLDCSSVVNYQKDQMIYSIFRKDPWPPKRELLWMGEATETYDGRTAEKRHVSFELYAYERGI